MHHVKPTTHNIKLHPPPSPILFIFLTHIPRVTSLTFPLTHSLFTPALSAGCFYPRHGHLTSLINAHLFMQ